MNDSQTLSSLLFSNGLLFFGHIATKAVMDDLPYNFGHMTGVTIVYWLIFATQAQR